MATTTTLEKTDAEKYYEVPVTVYAEVNSAGDGYDITKARIDPRANDIIDLIATKQKDAAIKPGPPPTVGGGSSSHSSRGGKSKRNRKSRGRKSKKARKSLRRR